MRKIFNVIVAVGLLSTVGAGCAGVGTSMGGNTAQTGDAWYIKTSGMGGFIFSSKVFYCPAPTSAGPATCKEAKMVEGDKK